MKCIHCGRISRARERTRGRCPGCRHPFAFDPRARPGISTDAEFQEAIDRVSGGGRLWFTARQLWMATTGRSQRPDPPPRGSVVPFVVGLALPGLLIALFAGMPGMVVAALGAAAGAAIGGGVARHESQRYRDGLAPLVSYETFLRYELTPWLQVHGHVPGLLPRHRNDAVVAPRQAQADEAALTVDRVLVTDRRDTAQILVANGFHLRHNCAVLSRGGYPAGMADTARRALRDNPHLTVFALHDASPDGCNLPLELRGPEWFPDPSVRIVDLGLRPETVIRLQLPPLPGGRQQALSAGLDQLLPYEDRQWLAEGYVYELAAVPSAELMRAAYEGMLAAGPGAGSGGTAAHDGGSWTGGAVWAGALAGVSGADTAAVDGLG